MILLLSALAFAEDPVFLGTADGSAVEAPETHLSAELGGTMATGNAVYLVIGGATEMSHKWSQNQVGLKAAVQLGQTVVDADGNGYLDEDERDAGLKATARRFGGELRYDRFFGEKDSLYALAGAFMDPFSGYDWRAHEQLGYGRVLVDAERPSPLIVEGEEPDTLVTQLSTEVGVDYAQEDYIPGVDPNYRSIVAGRVQLAFVHEFSPWLSFDDEVELLENVLDPEDLRVNNKATLTTKVGPKLNLKLSHALTFDNQPVEGFEPLDMITMATLVASIL